MNIILSQMCFKCDVIGTNYSLPNSDYDTRKRKIKYSNNSLPDRRACSRLSFSDLNSFYQARADGRTLILMPVFLKCIILQCLYKLIVISKHGQLADGPDTYRISPCIMRCFFLAIHVTKRHLVLYIDV